METDGPRHSVSVSAIVVDDEGRILAIRRRDNNHWEPPGGVLELDESILDGLVREVHEETGLIVAPDRLTGVYKNMVRGIVALVFRCRIVDGLLVGSPEASETAWLSRPEVPELMSEAYSSRVLDALTAAPPAIRSHNGERLLTPDSTAGINLARNDDYPYPREDPLPETNR